MKPVSGRAKPSKPSRPPNMSVRPLGAEIGIGVARHADLGAVLAGPVRLSGAVRQAKADLEVLEPAILEIVADVAPPRDLLADRQAALVEQGEDVEDRRVGEIERRAAGGQRRDVRRAVAVEGIIDARDEIRPAGRRCRIDDVGRALDRAVIVGELGGDERRADVPPHAAGELVAVGDLVEGLLAGDREIVERRDRVRDRGG